MLDFAEASAVDWLTEVIGYFFQAVGICLFSLALKYNQGLLSKKPAFIACIGADFVWMILSILINQ